MKDWGGQVSDAEVHVHVGATNYDWCDHIVSLLFVGSNCILQLSKAEHYNACYF